MVLPQQLLTAFFSYFEEIQHLCGNDDFFFTSAKNGNASSKMKIIKCSLESNWEPCHFQLDLLKCITQKTSTCTFIFYADISSHRNEKV